jgi:hypothetical protein
MMIAARRPIGSGRFAGLHETGIRSVVSASEMSFFSFGLEPAFASSVPA